LRDEFNYKPALSSFQFLSNGFAERKMQMISDIIHHTRTLAINLQKSQQPKKSNIKRRKSVIVTATEENNDVEQKQPAVRPKSASRATDRNAIKSRQTTSDIIPSTQSWITPSVPSNIKPVHSIVKDVAAGTTKFVATPDTVPNGASQEVIEHLKLELERERSEHANTVIELDKVKSELHLLRIHAEKLELMLKQQQDMFLEVQREHYPDLRKPTIPQAMPKRSIVTPTTSVQHQPQLQQRVQYKAENIADYKNATATKGSASWLENIDASVIVDEPPIVENDDEKQNSEQPIIIEDMKPATRVVRHDSKSSAPVNNNFVSINSLQQQTPAVATYVAPQSIDEQPVADNSDKIIPKSHGIPSEDTAKFMEQIQARLKQAHKILQRKNQQQFQ